MDEEREVTEVRQTNQAVDGGTVRRESVATAHQASGTTMVARVIWFIAGFIITLLALRVVLLLFGANQDSGFVSFIYTLSAPFAVPFYGIFAYEPSYGVSVLEVSSLVAIAIYALIAWGIARLMTLNRPAAEV